MSQRISPGALTQEMLEGKDTSWMSDRDKLYLDFKITDMINTAFYDSYAYDKVDIDVPGITPPIRATEFAPKDGISYTLDDISTDPEFKEWAENTGMRDPSEAGIPTKLLDHFTEIFTKQMASSYSQYGHTFGEGYSELIPEVNYEELKELTGKVSEGPPDLSTWANIKGMVENPGWVMEHLATSLMNPVDKLNIFEQLQDAGSFGKFATELPQYGEGGDKEWGLDRWFKLSGPRGNLWASVDAQGNLVNPNQSLTDPTRLVSFDDLLKIFPEEYQQAVDLEKAKNSAWNTNIPSDDDGDLTDGTMELTKDDINQWTDYLQRDDETGEYLFPDIAELWKKSGEFDKDISDLGEIKLPGTDVDFDSLIKELTTPQNYSLPDDKITGIQTPNRYRSPDVARGFTDTFSREGSRLAGQEWRNKGEYITPWLSPLERMNELKHQGYVEGTDIRPDDPDTSLWADPDQPPAENTSTVFHGTWDEYSDLNPASNATSTPPKNRGTYTPEFTPGKTQLELMDEAIAQQEAAESNQIEAERSVDDVNSMVDTWDSSTTLPETTIPNIQADQPVSTVPDEYRKLFESWDKHGVIQRISQGQFTGNRNAGGYTNKTLDKYGPTQHEFGKYADHLNAWTDEVDWGWGSNKSSKFKKKRIDDKGLIWNI